MDQSDLRTLFSHWESAFRADRSAARCRYFADCLDVLNRLPQDVRCTAYVDMIRDLLGTIAAHPDATTELLQLLLENSVYAPINRAVLPKAQEHSLYVETVKALLVLRRQMAVSVLSDLDFLNYYPQCFARFLGQLTTTVAVDEYTDGRALMPKTWDAFLTVYDIDTMDASAYAALLLEIAPNVICLDRGHPPEEPLPLPADLTL